MTRLVLLVILGLVTAIYFEDSRAVLVEKMAPIVNPALAMGTRMEMKKIVEELEVQERDLRRPLPARGKWNDWLDTYYQADAGQDSWRRPYGYMVWPDSFAVISLGPDRVLNTSDDIRMVRTRSRRGR